MQWMDAPCWHRYRCYVCLLRAHEKGELLIEDMCRPVVTYLCIIACTVCHRHRALFTCPVHAADECIHGTEGDKTCKLHPNCFMAAVICNTVFCQITLDTCYVCFYTTRFANFFCLEARHHTEWTHSPARSALFSTMVTTYWPVALSYCSISSLCFLMSVVHNTYSKITTKLILLQQTNYTHSLFCYDFYRSTTIKAQFLLKHQEAIKCRESGSWWNCPHFHQNLRVSRNSNDGRSLPHQRRLSTSFRSYSAR